jgi:hypothetical protein
MRRILLSATFLLLTGAANAQTNPMQMAQLAGANQIGVMEYCQGKGWADQAAVDAQRSGMAGLPPALDQSGVAAAEATGKSGSLLNNGQAMSLASMAGRTNTTEQALCENMAQSAKAVAAQMRAMPKGFPAMPNGMVMPSMPGMPKPQ